MVLSILQFLLTLKRKSKLTDKILQVKFNAVNSDCPYKSQCASKWSKSSYISFVSGNVTTQILLLGLEIV